jgi:hypothetical protein
MTEQTEPRPPAEEEILARASIRIVLGGQPHRLVPLTIDKTRVWKRHLAARVGAAWKGFGLAANDWTTLVATVGALTDQHVAMLVAYDEAHDEDGNPTRPGVLGGLAYIESHAGEREVWDGLKAVLDEAFPSAGELLRRVPPALLIPTALQLLGSSTNSPLPAGPPSEAPRSSNRASRRASSRS